MTAVGAELSAAFGSAVSLPRGIQRHDVPAHRVPGEVQRAVGDVSSGNGDGRRHVVDNHLLLAEHAGARRAWPACALPPQVGARDRHPGGGAAGGEQVEVACRSSQSGKQDDQRAWGGRVGDEDPQRCAGAVCQHDLVDDVGGPLRNGEVGAHSGEVQRLPPKARRTTTPNTRMPAPTSIEITPVHCSSCEMVSMTTSATGLALFSDDAMSFFR